MQAENVFLGKKIVINKYPVDTTRIYATGMSNGGFMCYRLACELPGRFAAIAPVAASMSMADCSPDKQLPIIHFHSYLDSSVPYSCNNCLQQFGTGGNQKRKHWFS